MRIADELLLCAAHFEVMKLTWDQERRLQDQREALISEFKMEEWRTNSVARRVAEPESSDLDSEAGASRSSGAQPGDEAGARFTGNMVRPRPARGRPQGPLRIRPLVHGLGRRDP